MTNPMIKIHNMETGEIIEREMNASELAQQVKDKAEAKTQEDARTKAEADKAALLAKLGITADEAKLLLQ
jgi:hypothetical protein